MTPTRADVLRDKPLAIDLFCGLGGWTEGLLAEGYDVIGFDLERHRYAVPDVPEGEGGKGTRPVEKRGWTQGCAISLGMEGPTKRADTRIIEYPAQLVLQDVLTLHGRQFKSAALIVASPPCQEYSYMAMPWSRAKAIAAEYRSGVRDVKQLTALFDACFRIQREACEAAGRHIPLVVENVRGAIPWVGRSRWNFGSFHLWGDVPALMPMTKSMKNTGGSWFAIGSSGQKVTNNNARDELTKVPGFRFDGSGRSFQSASVEGVKHGGDCFNDPTWHGKQGGTKQPGIGGLRDNGKGDAWFQDGAARHGS